MDILDDCADVFEGDYASFISMGNHVVQCGKAVWDIWRECYIWNSFVNYWKNFFHMFKLYGERFETIKADFKCFWAALKSSDSYGAGKCLGDLERLAVIPDLS